MVVFFTHAPDLLDHLRSSFGPTSEITYTDLFEQVRQVPMLILDGIGSQSTTSWAEEKLRQIINSRYNEELPTVITTSANLDDLDPYIATRTSDERVSTLISLGDSTPTLEHGIDLVPEDMLEHMTFEKETDNHASKDPPSETGVRQELVKQRILILYLSQYQPI